MNVEDQEERVKIEEWWGIIGECHYCGWTVVERFAGQYGAREVWVRRHAEGYADHEAITSGEVWAEDERTGREAI